MSKFKEKTRNDIKIQDSKTTDCLKNKNDQWMFLLVLHVRCKTHVVNWVQEQGEKLVTMLKRPLY